MKKFLAKVLASVLGSVDSLVPVQPESVDDTDHSVMINPCLAPQAPQGTWTHNKDLYHLMIPNTAFDPDSPDSGFMATVVTNKETNESRLIPYVMVPVATRITTVTSGTSGEVHQTREWEIIGDEV